MILQNIMRVMAVALSYYLFSDEFFRFSADIKQKSLSFTTRFLCFIIVYVWFFIASMLELPLIANWLVFLVILGIELHQSLSFDFLVSYTLSLFCTIIGLAMNIFFRSLMAILCNVPLTFFDNSVSSIKQYPIFFGFIGMGLLCLMLRRIKFYEKLQLMLENRKSLIFYAWIEVCVYLFLIIQLLVFSQTDNNMGIKLWGIKSAVFSIIALLMGNVYTLRVASLYLYMGKQHDLHHQLLQEKENMNNLWKLAYTDMLTGCNNRQLLEKRLKEYAGYGSDITLAFIDLNGLKLVNDQYGHLEGDHYLIRATSILTKAFDAYHADLFRYGGDEFVVMSNSLSVSTMEAILKAANECLQENHKEYHTSISYGVINGYSHEYERLITQADMKMYKEKEQYYQTLK